MKLFISENMAEEPSMHSAAIRNMRFHEMGVEDIIKSGYRTCMANNKTVTPIWAQTLLDARAGAADRFATDPDLATLWRALTHACDDAMHALFAPHADEICVVAVGSYGRSELLPHSDIDILILTGDQPPASLEATIAALWSSGLRIGHGVHTPASATKAMDGDITTLTSYLHPRYVCGDKALYDKFLRRKNTWRQAHSTIPLIDTLLAHRDSRHTRFGDSRFLLEPHVKDGKGGMRDAQMLAWLAYLAFGTRDIEKPSELIWPQQSADAYVHAYRFFAKVRSCLHLLYQRPEERLSFDAQLRCSQMLGYDGPTPEARAQAFMMEYFRCTRIIGECTRELCTSLDKHSKRTPPFRMSEPAALPHGLIWHEGRIDFAAVADPSEYVLSLFWQASARGRDVHPNAMHWVDAHREKLSAYYANTAHASQPLLDILLAPHPDQVLKRLNEAGVLSMIIPEYAHVSGQMQYDGYHTYTVDAHILLVVGNVYALEAGQLRADAPVTTQAAKDLVNRRALYIAALCHDLAKGTGGGHQDKGMDIAMRVARQLGLNEGEVELAGWLVKYHQHISDIAFKRDIADPETISALVELVQSPERLRLLMVLTVADIRAVGPTIWNGWKASVIRKLFERTMYAMGVKLDSYSESEHAITRLSDDERVALEKQGMVVSWQVKPDQSMTELMMVALYDRGLLRACAGALAYLGANIVSARSFMLGDGACRMIFTLQNGLGQAFVEEGRLARIADMLRHDGMREADVKAAIAKGGYVGTATASVRVTPAVFFDQRSSSSATLVEVNANDRAGLLYDMLRVFEASGMQVSGAYIATYGQRVVDVFYMKDRFGLKLHNAQKLKEIEQALLGVL